MKLVRESWWTYLNTFIHLVMTHSYGYDCHICHSFGNDCYSYIYVAKINIYITAQEVASHNLTCICDDVVGIL